MCVIGLVIGIITAAVQYRLMGRVVAGALASAYFTVGRSSCRVGPYFFAGLILGRRCHGNDDVLPGAEELLYVEKDGRVSDYA